MVRKEKVNIGKLLFSMFIISAVYALIVVMITFTSTINLSTVREYMYDYSIEKVRNNDLTLVRDGSSYYCDIYIFRGEEKIAISDGINMPDYDNWAFPFYNCFYIYKEVRKIAKQVDAENEERLRLKCERMLN